MNPKLFPRIRAKFTDNKGFTREGWVENPPPRFHIFPDKVKITISTKELGEMKSFRFEFRGMEHFVAHYTEC